MEIVSLLWIYLPVTSNRCFHSERHRRRTLVTEPHVGYSKDQIAQAVLDTELDTLSPPRSTRLVCPSTTGG